MTTRPRHKIVSDIEQSEQCISGIKAQITRIDVQIESIWDTFVWTAHVTYGLSTRRSVHLEYYYSYTSSYPPTISRVKSKLQQTNEALDLAETEMSNWKWYMIIGKDNLAKEIDVLTADRQILSRIIQLYNEDNEISAVLEEKRVMDERLSRMHECNYQFVNDMNEYDLHKLIDECDKLCPEKHIDE